MYCTSSNGLSSVNKSRSPYPAPFPSSSLVNPNTVHKAYRELEREGLVRARPGLGTFVTRVRLGTDPEPGAGFLADLTGWLRSARSAGRGPDDIEAIYRTAFRACFAEGVALRARSSRPAGWQYLVHLGAARLHAGHPRRPRGRAGRPERRGQDHPAAPGHRDAHADPRHDHRPRPTAVAASCQLARVGFVAQDRPLSEGPTVADHLRLGAWLNPGWDDNLAQQRIGQLALELLGSAPGRCPAAAGPVW